jgi:hypothetical protein
MAMVLFGVTMLVAPAFAQSTSLFGGGAANVGVGAGGGGGTGMGPAGSGPGAGGGAPFLRDNTGEPTPATAPVVTTKKKRKAS